MQRIPAWLRSPSMVIAFAVILCGIVILVHTFAPRFTTPAYSSEAAAELDEEPAQDSEPLSVPTAAPTPAPTAATEASIVVAISGAVRAPEAYRLPAEARIKDLVLAAGGLTTDADADRINLAKRLKDEEHIHILRQGELPVAANDSSAAAAPDAPAEQLININTASAAEFEGLPGIGKVLAKRIADYRAVNGPFKTIEDLRQVKGISAALLNNITPSITAGP